MAARYPRYAVLVWLHGAVRRRYVAAMVRREEESGRVNLADIIVNKIIKHLSDFLLDFGL